MVRFCPHIKCLFRTFAIAILVVLLAVSSNSYAQDAGPAIIDRFYNKPGPNTIRKILSNISLGVSSGYGQTYYRHELSNAAIIQKKDGLPFLFSSSSNINNDTINTVYSNWFNQVESVNQLPINRTDDYIISSDTARIVYKSRSRGVPILLTLHYEFLRYRIGAGMSWEYHKVKTFNSKFNSTNLSSFQPNISKEKFKRYFVYLGGTVWNYYEFSATVDGQVGMYNLGGKFADPKGFYFNLGVSVDREFSEYFSVFIRPSFEYKRFKTVFPESSLSINHSMPSFFLNVGVQLNLPELRKCKISNCETQINHTHGGGKEWRSRSHPFYRKQNPHYGENYPKLYKYKWWKRRKLNAY